MTIRRSFVPVCWFLIVLGAPAQEEKPPADLPPQDKASLKLEEIVVTATRTEREREAVPGSVSVVSRKDLEGINLQDAGDALENLAGLKVSRHGSLGSVVSAHLRGLYSAHTLVLVDGRPVNAPSLSSADLSWLSLENLDRIEVVRGAASALYGADAVGGVVQFLTSPPPKKPAAKLATSFGAWNTCLTSFSHGATLSSEEQDGPSFGYLLGANKKVTDGFRDNTGYDSIACDLKLSAEVSQKDRITLTGGYSGSKTGIAGPRPPADPALWSLSQQVLGSDEASSLYDRGEARRWHAAFEARMDNLVLRGYRNDWQEDVHQEYLDWAAERHLSDYDHDTMMHGAEVQYTWDVHQTDSITAGAGIRLDGFESRSRDLNVATGVGQESGWEADRRTAALFLQNEFRLGPVRFTIGGRWDEPSDFEGQFTGRAGFVYEFPSRTTLRLTGGQAFRAPSLNDLYWPSDDWAQGNPNLKPETGISYEIGLGQAIHETLAMNLTLFRQEMREMIVWAPTGPPGLFGPKWQPDNLNRANINGLEGEIKFRPLDFLAFNLRYTLLDAEQQNMELVDSATNAMTKRRRRLAYASRHKADVGLELKDPAGLKGFRANLDWQFQSAIAQYYPRYAPFPDTWVAMDTKELSAFSTLNMKLSYKLDRLEFYIAADNLFDEKYAMQFGNNVYDRNYPMPGRCFTAGVSLEY